METGLKNRQGYICVIVKFFYEWNNDHENSTSSSVLTNNAIVNVSSLKDTNYVLPQDIFPIQQKENKKKRQDIQKRDLVIQIKSNQKKSETKPIYCTKIKSIQVFTRIGHITILWWLLRYTVRKLWKVLERQKRKIG